MLIPICDFAQARPSVQCGSLWQPHPHYRVARADRVATVERSTKETRVSVTINLDGTGKCEAHTGIPFLDHMLDVSPSTPAS